MSVALLILYIITVVFRKAILDVLGAWRRGPVVLSGWTASADMRIEVPLDLPDARVLFTLPLIDRVEFGTGGEQLGLLCADLEVVLIAHVEGDSGDIDA